ncbi:MAG: YqaE/Pmp3 family membrane protein [Bacteroidia bacterium]
MKKSIQLSIVAIIAILLSSCGSLSISQKRYSRGLNIDWFSAKDDNGGKKTPKPKKEKNTKTIIQNETIAADANVTIDEEDVKEELAKESIVEEEVQNDIVSSTQSRQKHSFLKSNKSLDNNFESSSDVSKKSNFNSPKIKETLNSTHSSNDADAELILLIILAFLIPPIAIFLYFGEIETHFWISILLCLLAVGAFTGGLFFGWGLPVVHALLVIFGIFD